MKIGYARVSSYGQVLDIQKKLLMNFGCEKIYSEIISAKDNSRNQLNKMIEDLRAGDIVIVSKIDRIARSLKGLIEIIEIFNYKKVNFISLDSGDKVDTTSPIGKAFFQIAGVFAELERNMIKNRTKDGIENAKNKGVKFGRVIGSKNKSTENKVERAKIFLQVGKTYNWIAKELCISKQTIANIKKGII